MEQGLSTFWTNAATDLIAAIRKALAIKGKTSATAPLIYAELEKGRESVLALIGSVPGENSTVAFVGDKMRGDLTIEIAKEALLHNQGGGKK